MEYFIAIAFVILLFAIIFALCSKQRSKILNEVIARRENFLTTISPNAHAIINNGLQFFFVDDVRGCFGFDESGNTYSYDGITSLLPLLECIEIQHSTAGNICIGKSICDKDSDKTPLDIASISKIINILLPILKNNLHKDLDKHGLVPTLEYEHEGAFWGCDMNKKIFYTTFSCIHYFDFSKLIGTSVEDMTNNQYYDGNYILHLYIKSEINFDTDEYDLTFHRKDAKFYSLLNMFDEIYNKR